MVYKKYIIKILATYIDDFSVVYTKMGKYFIQVH